MRSGAVPDAAGGAKCVLRAARCCVWSWPGRLAAFGASACVWRPGQGCSAPASVWAPGQASRRNPGRQTPCPSAQRRCSRRCARPWPAGMFQSTGVTADARDSGQGERSRARHTTVQRTASALRRWCTSPAPMRRVGEAGELAPTGVDAAAMVVGACGAAVSCGRSAQTPLTGCSVSRGRRGARIVVNPANRRAGVGDPKGPPSTTAAVGAARLASSGHETYRGREKADSRPAIKLAPGRGPCRVRSGPETSWSRCGGATEAEVRQAAAFASYLKRHYAAYTSAKLAAFAG